MNKLPKYPPRIRTSTLFEMLKSVIELSQRSAVKAAMILLKTRELEFYESILSINKEKEVIEK